MATAALMTTTMCVGEAMGAARRRRETVQLYWLALGTALMATAALMAAAFMATVALMAAALIGTTMCVGETDATGGTV